MQTPFIVTDIETIDYGHKKRVYIMDTRTGEMYETIYGDSVTDKYIRFVAPLLLTKTKRGKRSNA